MTFSLMRDWRSYPLKPYFRTLIFKEGRQGGRVDLVASHFLNYDTVLETTSKGRGSEQP